MLQLALYQGRLGQKKALTIVSLNAQCFCESLVVVNIFPVVQLL